MAVIFISDLHISRKVRICSRVGPSNASVWVFPRERYAGLRRRCRDFRDWSSAVSYRWPERQWFFSLSRNQFKNFDQTELACSARRNGEMRRYTFKDRDGRSTTLLTSAVTRRCHIHARSPRHAIARSIARLLRHRSACSLMCLASYCALLNVPPPSPKKKRPHKARQWLKTPVTRSTQGRNLSYKSKTFKREL